MRIFPQGRGAPDSFLTTTARVAIGPRFSFRSLIFLALLPLAELVSGPAAAETDQAAELRLELQKQQYEAVATKTITELQQFRQSQSATLKSGDQVTLTDLNPAINAWWLLEIAPKNGGRSKFYHIENTDPEKLTLRLAMEPAVHLVIEGGVSTYRCVPWKRGKSPLDRAQEAGLPFSPLCGGRLYLRNRVRGSRTNLEATSQFLRDNVWLGENLVGFVKDTFFKDEYLETAEEIDAEPTGIEPVGLVKADLETAPVVATRMGLTLDGTQSGRMTMGAWYPVTDLPGVFATTMQPKAISRRILAQKSSANRLDQIEGRAQTYLVAYDLSQFDLGYEMGTTHPRLDWSPRPSGAGRNYNIPGPDGVKSPAPLINLGMVSPGKAARVVATFTGGFKRDHGAFRYGPYATENNGTHYGFIVHGVVMSKLQPNLATLIIMDDGTVTMKTWTREDDALLPHIRFARQNGVALVERDPESHQSAPGPLVPHWGAGNWSGSAKAELRTLRAGACLREAEGKQFLIYGYFSTATPSAMARSFQALSCDYAMLLDMNALEHTYSAVYVRRNGALQTQHLLPGMAYIDRKQRDGSRIPRFIGSPDNRDFFYLTRKEVEN